MARRDGPGVFTVLSKAPSAGTVVPLTRQAGAAAAEVAGRPPVVTAPNPAAPAILAKILRGHAGGSCRIKTQDQVYVPGPTR